MILAFGVFASTSNSIHAQKSTKRCSAPVTVSMKRRSLLDAISTVLNAFSQPIQLGLVYQEPLRPAKRLTLDFGACSIEEAFDRITKEYGGYRWTFNEGVVNFIPTTPHETVDPNWLLSHKLDKCQTQAKSLPQATAFLLRQLHGLNLPVRLDAMPPATEEGPRRVSKREYKITLSAKDTTISQCLNYLVLAAPGEALWLIAVDKGRAALGMSIRQSEGFWRAQFSKSEFSRYGEVTDRLAELRGVKATRELTKAERKEQQKLRQEYEDLLKLGRKKKR